uniref:Homeobox domain-containing protein n=1 Tax=Timema shepardi TaxID=629360 RepID=A0A7R9FYG5_TIMSH|nr:unnamed protein product [Timema shepardi]
MLVGDKLYRHLVTRSNPMALVKVELHTEEATLLQNDDQSEQVYMSDGNTEPIGEDWLACMPIKIEAINSLEPETQDDCGEPLQLAQEQSFSYYSKDVSPPINLVSSRSKYSSHQLARLQEEFSRDRYPDIHRREALGGELGMTPLQVLSWFKSKRKIKEANKTKKRERVLEGEAAKRKKSEFLNPDQLQRLKREFKKDSTLTAERRRHLALQLGLGEKRVREWFAGVHRRLRQMGDSEMTRRLLLNSLGAKNFEPFTEEQQQCLELNFDKNHYPGKEECQKLASELGSGDPQRVYKWFARRRQSHAQEKTNCDCASKGGPRTFTVKQLLRLEQEFNLNFHPPRERWEALAAELDLPEVRVYKWFVNKRNEMRRSNINSDYLALLNRFNRRSSSSLSIAQIQALEEVFKTVHYPSKEEAERLAAQLGIESEKRITRWFDSKRQRVKRLTGVAFTPPVRSGTSGHSGENAGRFTDHQVERLEQEFLADPRPSIDEIGHMATELGLTEIKVHNWFVGRRLAIKKKGKDIPPPNRPEKVANRVQKNKHSFSSEQVMKLMAEFKLWKTPTMARCEQLSAELGASSLRVNNWFKSRRSAIRDGYKLTRRKIKKQHFLEENQLEGLKQEFIRQCEPDREHFRKLADNLGLLLNRVISWFTTQRNRMERSQLDEGDPASRCLALVGVTTGNYALRGAKTWNRLEETFISEGRPSPEAIAALSHELEVGENIIREWFTLRQHVVKRKEVRQPEVDLNSAPGTSKQSVSTVIDLSDDD